MPANTVANIVIFLMFIVSFVDLIHLYDSIDFYWTTARQVSLTPEQIYFSNKNEMQCIDQLQIITSLMTAHGLIQTQTSTRLKT